MQQSNNTNQPLRSAEVMARIGYRSRAAFWAAVHSQGIPHVRITDRHIVFYEASLNDWMARRQVGKASA